MARPIPTPRRIPTFSSIEEEAAFWDSHDTTDFEDEFVPVQIEVAQPLGHILSIQLEPAAFHRLSTIARTHGANLVTLAETWILEALARAAETSAETADETNRADSYRAPS